MATIKVNQISHWLKERRRDLTAVASHDLLVERIDEWPAAPGAAPREREHIAALLDAIREANSYEGVTLLDAEGRPRLSVGRGGG